MLHKSMTGFSTLESQRCLSLTTFLADGQPKSAPVWFAQKGDKLYVMLPETAEEAARIHHNAQVEVTPCTERGNLLGTAIEAMALILPNDQAVVAHRALAQKYGVPLRWQEVKQALRRVRCVYLEITPM